MFFSKRAFNALSSSSRCFGDNSVFVLTFFILVSFLLLCRVSRSFRNKSSKDMAFPHPKSRKDNYRNGDKPNNGGVIWNFFKRTINITEYRNAKEDVDRAKNRTFGGIFHDWLLTPFVTRSGGETRGITCRSRQNTNRPMGALRRMRQPQPDYAPPIPVQHPSLARR